MTRKLIYWMGWLLTLPWALLIWNIYVVEKTQGHLLYFVALVMGLFFALVQILSVPLLLKIRPIYNFLVGGVLIALLLISIQQRGNDLIDMIVLDFGIGFLPLAAKRLSEFEIRLWNN